MDRARVTRVRLLDGFALQTAGTGSAPDLPRVVQRLIAHVSLAGRPARTAIAGKLWPEVTEEHAHGSLRSSLWRVHKVAPGLITVSGDTLSIAQDVLVDVHELTDWARRALDPCAATDTVAPGDLGLPSELLPGWYDDWVLLERERLRQLRMHALEALAEKYAAAARYGEATQAAYAAVRAEPLRESAHRTVVRVHLAEGNVAEAIRAFESFRAMLAEELGATPTQQMCRLIDSLPEAMHDGGDPLGTRNRRSWLRDGSRLGDGRSRPATAWSAGARSTAPPARRAAEWAFLDPADP